MRQLLIGFFITILFVSVSATEDIEELKAQLATLAGEDQCLNTLPLARKIYAQDRRHIPALQVMADCAANEQGLQQYAMQAKELFEESKVLSVVPKLLQMANVKELVPIIKEVEVKEDKSIGDYLMLNEIYSRLGEPEKQMRTLEAAMQANPEDPRPLLLLATKKMDQGDRVGAEKLYKLYLSLEKPHPGRAYLMAYVMALTYPLAVSLTLIALIWGLGAYIARRNRQRFEALHGRFTDREIKVGWTLLVVVAPIILAVRFWETGQALPFGALLLMLGGEVFFIAKPHLASLVEPVWISFKKALSVLFNGILLAKKMAQLSSGWRVLIALGALFTLGTIAPTIEWADLRYGVILTCSLVLYATLGSLLVTFLRSSQSLQVSMRWIGISATLPFLMSYLIANWNTLGVPLMYARLPSGQAINNLFNYLVFWGVSLTLALHLSKIIAEALSQPVREIMDKVARIEKGEFQAKVEVMSCDEIGRLGQAVNRMGEGLERREKVEKTFRKYVDGQVAERILAGCETEVRIEGQTMEGVVLFVDIRGFTAISEKISAESVVHILNQFFEHMVHIVRDNEGVVDKFMGDNIMAVWGVPQSIENPEEKAVRAALGMLKEMDVWNAELKEQGYPSVGIGLGINSGPLVAGSLGSSDRMEYTVIGDVVNTAQRAESMAQRQQLLITDVTYQKLKDLLVVTELEPVKVKGKSQPQRFWAVERFLEDTAKEFAA